MAEGGIVDEQLSPEQEQLRAYAIDALDPNTPLSDEARNKILMAFEEVFGKGSVEELAKQLDASEGSETGVGPTDTVPAMLTPGEFVVPEDVVQNVGEDNLYQMMDQARGLAQGQAPVEQRGLGAATGMV